MIQVLIWDGLWLLVHRLLFISYIFTKVYNFDLYYWQFITCRNVIWLIHTDKEKFSAFAKACWLNHSELHKPDFSVQSKIWDGAPKSIELTSVFMLLLLLFCVFIDADLCFIKK